MRPILYALMVLVSCPCVKGQVTKQADDQGDGVKIVSPFKKYKDTPKLRLGLTASPLLTWASQKDNDIYRGKLRGGVEYGGIVEYFFTPNIGLSSGVTVLYNGGNLIYKDSADIKTFNTDKPVTALFKFQYLTIPLSAKIKSNQIGHFTYYGELGFLLGFCIDAKVDAEEDGGVVLYDGANFLTRKNNQTDDHLLSTLVNFSLHAGGGAEYAINERISLVMGIMYNNGFVKVVQDISGRSVTLDNVVFKVGILF